MGVAGAQAVAVVEGDVEAPAVVVAGERDAAGGGRGDGVPAGGREVEAGVEARAARAVAVPDRRGDRPPQRGRGDRRARSAASVAGPATPSAGSPAKACTRRTAASVRAPKPPSTVPHGKPWVSSANCSAATSQPRWPDAQRAAADRMAAERPERPPRARPDDPVGVEPRARLEAADARGGRGPGQPVDRPA